MKTLDMVICCFFLCFVAKRENPSTPSIPGTTLSTELLPSERPTNADGSMLMRFVTKYRKDGESDWNSMPETRNLWETVTGLDADTIYEFQVSVMYGGGQTGPQSDLVRVKTKKAAPGSPTSFLRATALCYSAYM